MTFEEFLSEVWKYASLPSIARLQLPNSLSDKTKRKLLKMDPVEVARILEGVVDKINCGSVESIDALIK